MTRQIGDVVLLAGIDDDFGLFDADGAHERARELASEEGVTVTIRNHLTDEVIAIVEPDGKGAMSVHCLIETIL